MKPTKNTGYLDAHAPRRIPKRRTRTLMSLEDRLRAAREKARQMEIRRCPDCGKLCRNHGGNSGMRAQCEECGG